MRFRAVIFDLDGTLLDTIEDITRALNAVFAPRGCPPLSVEACKKLVGEGMEALIHKALPEVSCDEGLVRDIIRDFRREYDVVWREHSRPYPGILELLEKMRDRGIRSAVLSNKAHPVTVRMTRELVPFRFDVVRGAIPGIPLKPDPCTALKIAAEMEILPENIVFLGDSSIDMKTALAAGMFAAGACWGFRGEEELAASGADALIAYPTELLGFLD
jgi:phosphoglycolate phosphatase